MVYSRTLYLYVAFRLYCTKVLYIRFTAVSDLLDYEFGINIYAFYNILQKFILLVALGYFIWWLNGGIDDLKYQVYKEKREEVVKMILEGEIKKEVSSKLIDLPEKYKIISSGGDILYLESPLSDSVFGFWETRGIVSSGSTMYIYSCQEENQLKKIIRNNLYYEQIEIKQLDPLWYYVKLQ